MRDAQWSSRCRRVMGKGVGWGAPSDGRGGRGGGGLLWAIPRKFFENHVKNDVFWAIQNFIQQQFKDTCYV